MKVAEVFAASLFVIGVLLIGKGVGERITKSAYLRKAVSVEDLADGREGGI